MLSRTTSEVGSKAVGGEKRNVLEYGGVQKAIVFLHVRMTRGKAELQRGERYPNKKTTSKVNKVQAVRKDREGGGRLSMEEVYSVVHPAPYPLRR